MVEEIIKLKAEIFDIIRQQEAYIANANNLQQKRLQKTQELKSVEEKGNIEEIMKLKSQAYDIITQQDAYIASANNLQEIKIQKLQILNKMEQKAQELDIQQIAQVSNESQILHTLGKEQGIVK